MTPYVLVVEDEDALATLLHYNLDKEGYRVGVAGDGEQDHGGGSGQHGQTHQDGSQERAGPGRLRDQPGPLRDVVSAFHAHGGFRYHAAAGAVNPEA